MVYYIGCPFAVLGSEIAYVDKELAYCYTTPLERMIEAFKYILKQNGIADNELDDKSRQAFALFEGNVMYYRVTKDIPFVHKHKTHEEVYVVIKGSGEFIVDGEVTPIKEGTIIRVGLDGIRKWRNNSNKDLIMICIQRISGTMKDFTVNDGYM